MLTQNLDFGHAKSCDITVFRRCEQKRLQAGESR